MTELADAEVAKLWSIVAVFAGLAGAAMLHEMFFRYLWKHDLRGDVIELRPRPVHS
jgi:hypothetical protein